MRAGQRYFVGLDLGQARDYTAVAVLQRDRWPPATPALPAYTLGHLERYQLGTGYPQVVRSVGALLGRSPLRGGPTLLAVDGTGVGRAVVDMVRPVYQPTPVLITGGAAVTVDPEGYWHVPKRDLVGVLQALLQSRRLRIPAALPLADTLARELGAFRVKLTAAANESFEAWRERDHDDLVLAVALAAWCGERVLAEEQADGGDGGALDVVRIR